MDRPLDDKIGKNLDQRNGVWKKWVSTRMQTPTESSKSSTSSASDASVRLRCWTREVQHRIPASCCACRGMPQSPARRLKMVSPVARVLKPMEGRRERKQADGMMEPWRWRWCHRPQCAHAWWEANEEDCCSMHAFLLSPVIPTATRRGNNEGVSKDHIMAHPVIPGHIVAQSFLRLPIAQSELLRWTLTFTLATTPICLWWG